MNKSVNKTESVKISIDKANIAREVKKKTGIPIGRVIEDAIQYYVDDTKILQKPKAQS